MDFSLSKSSASNLCCLFDSNISQSVDSDLTLPEYVDDIESVLNCSLTGETESVNVSENRITVEGNARIRLLYVSKKGFLQCFESAVPFSRFFDPSNVTSDDFVNVSVSTQYANCRLVNPRRFDVHGNLIISVRVESTAKSEFVGDADGAGIQVKRETVPVSNAVCVKGKSFTLSEVLEIPENLPDIAQIIGIYPTAVPGETKLISKKALVKGELTMDIVYLTDEKQSSVSTAQFSLPISQIVETDCDDEQCVCVTKIGVSAVDYAVRANTGAGVRLIDISVSSFAQVEIFRNEELSAVTDAYSTEFETECEKKGVELRLLKEQFSDSCLCRAGFSTGKEISEIISLVTKDLTCSTALRDRKLTVSGSVRAGITVKYSDGEKGYMEKQLEYEYQRETDCAEAVCEKSVRVGASSFLLTSGTNADVRVEIEINAAVFEIIRKQLVCDISVQSENPKKPDEAALTLYYPDGEESVWEIAKKYNTTVSAIKRENQLENETVSRGSMLLLPRM